MRLLILIFLSAISRGFSQNEKLRPLADTVGFAHTKSQIDSVIARITRHQEEKLSEARSAAGVSPGTAFKIVIAPHDDYAYTGYLYPLALQNVKAKTVIIFGVAHKAKVLGLENKLIFDCYSHWSGPYGNIRVSPLRKEIIADLPRGAYEVNDTMQRIEHSVEAEIPFLQAYNKNVEIVSILVPYMPYDTMTKIAKPLATAITKSMKKEGLQWGADVAIVISADAVHYGDEDWGGKNFAFYGADSAGYAEAVAHEKEITEKCFSKPGYGPIKQFVNYTVREDNYKEYKWTWCGRYSVPMGLLTGLELATALKTKIPDGKILAYETSLSNKHIPVPDLGGMGVTAPAKLRHWVGYAAVGFW